MTTKVLIYKADGQAIIRKHVYLKPLYGNEVFTQVVDDIYSRIFFRYGNEYVDMGVYGNSIIFDPNMEQDVMDKYNNHLSSLPTASFIRKIDIELYSSLGMDYQALQTRQDEILIELGINPHRPMLPFYCTVSWLHGLYKFDVVAIDDELKRKYSDYSDDMSMEQFITIKKGAAFAAEFREYI